MVQVLILSRENKKYLSAQKSNSNTVGFNFQMYARPFKRFYYSSFSKCISKYFADTNECDPPGLCSQQCINTKGSFKCQCEEGYTLIKGKQCFAYRSKN